MAENEIEYPKEDLVQDYKDDSASDWQKNARYAGFSARLIACTLDSIVLLIPLSFILTFVFEFLWGGRSLSPEEAGLLSANFANVSNNPDIALLKEKLMMDISKFFLEIFITALITAVITIVFWSKFSATPGKMLKKIVIVDAKTGTKPTNKQDIIRYLGYFFSGAFFGLGVIWIFFDKKRRAWHDFMAGTVVVYKNSLPENLRKDSE